MDKRQGYDCTPLANLHPPYRPFCTPLWFLSKFESFAKIEIGIHPIRVGPFFILAEPASMIAPLLIKEFSTRIVFACEKPVSAGLT